MLKGHLFLLHADLVDVPYDVLVLPTDHTFTVGEQWKPFSPNPKRPARFDEQHFGRAGDSKLWWVDVTRGGVPDRPALIANATACLADIAETLATPLLRVALPVLGTGEGGQDEESGALQLDLLEALRKAAEHHQLDVLLATKDERRFQALQDARLPDPARWFPGIPDTGRGDEPTLTLAQRLGTRARRGELSVFLGAGVSVGAGLPDWAGLVSAIVRASALPDTLTVEQFSRLSLLDQAELLQRRDPKFAQAVVDQVKHAAKPGLAHLLLASLRAQQSATTNYDDLYERAVRSADPARRLAVLPYQRRTDGRPWLLKLHGDIDHPDDIVLSRSQFAAYDARHRPAGALFQAMLLTSHLLVVGASLTDDNVLRLVHEVRDYLATTAGNDHFGDHFGTVLTLHPEPARCALWSGELDWVSLERPDDESPRVLEILLDAVAMHAYSASTSVLDERFDTQLASDRERDLARRLRSIAGEVEKQTGHAWQGLKTTLGL